MELSVFSFALPLLSTLMGYRILIYLTQFRLRTLELIGGAIPLGIVMTSVSALLLNPILSCVLFHYSFQCVFCAGLWLVFLFRTRKISLPNRFPSFLSFVGILTFIGILSWISWVAYVRTDGKVLYTGQNDLYLEFCYVSSFVHGANKCRGFFTGILLPLVSGNPGKSEYLPCIYTALIQVAGSSMQVAVFVHTIMLFTSISLLQFSLTLRICESEFAGLLSIPVVFLLGGFGFMHFLVNADRLNGGVDYVFFVGGKSVHMWGHPMLHCILTSRVVMLTMSLSILVFILLEQDQVHCPGILCLVCAVIRPQTGFALAICFGMYTMKNMVPRSMYLALSAVVMKVVGLTFDWKQPLWRHTEYANSFCPPLAFPMAIFGLMFPSFVFCMFTKGYIGRLVAPMLSFYLLSVLSLQTELRFNFFALIATAVPLFCAISLSGMVSFGARFRSDEVRGCINCLVIFVAIFMSLSSITGLWARLYQEFEMWDEQGLDVARWVMANTKPDAVFASQLTGSWNPAVVVAGRLAFVSIQPTMQSASYSDTGRRNELSTFVRDRRGSPSVDFYITERNKEWETLLSDRIGVDLSVAFSNRWYTILKLL